MTRPLVESAVALSFLHGLPGDLVEQLLATGHCVDVSSGTTVYRPGDVPWRFSWCTACFAST